MTQSVIIRETELKQVEIGRDAWSAIRRKTAVFFRKAVGLFQKHPAEKPGIALDACSEGERVEPGTEMLLFMELADILRTSMDALTDAVQI